jgi:hypothetical protein
LDDYKEEFVNNMKYSEFSFCPRGTGNFSTRFYEALHNGRIPVLIDTDTVLPFEKHIDYSKICVFSSSIDNVVDDVIAFSKNNDLVQTQILCKEIFNTYFHIDNIAKYMYDEMV